MVDEKINVEMKNIQTQIDKIRADYLLSPKQKKQLEELEYGVNVGLMAPENVQFELNSLLNTLKQKTSKKDESLQYPLLSGDYLAKKQPRVLNLPVLLPVLGQKVEQQLNDLPLDETEMTNEKIFKILLLNYLKLEISTIQKMVGSSEVIAEIVSEEVGEYEKIIDALRNIELPINEKIVTGYLTKIIREQSFVAGESSQNAECLALKPVECGSAAIWSHHFNKQMAKIWAKLLPDVEKNVQLQNAIKLLEI